MERAQVLRAEQVAASDLVMWCSAVDQSDQEKVDDARLRQLATARCPTLLGVTTRCDLQPDVSFVDLGSNFRVSAANGDGIEPLRHELQQQLAGSLGARSELLGTTAVRCRDSLQRTIQSLVHARSTTIELCGDELIAIEIRDALQELSTILGEVYTDDILDHIFSNFCIGK